MKLVRLVCVSSLIIVVLSAGSLFIVQQRRRSSSKDRTAASAALAKININYPLEGSVFPPEITPPTFLWTDPTDSAKHWVAEVSFADRSAGIRLDVAGEHLQRGEIDPTVVADGELSQLTPEQAAMRTWQPDAETWDEDQTALRESAGHDRDHWVYR